MASYSCLHFLLLFGGLFASSAFGFDEHALPRYTRQSWQTENGLPQNTVHAIVQTHDGYIWLATEGGVARFDGLKFDVFNSQNTPAFKSSNVRALVEDAEHSLWVGTADGLLRLRNSQFTCFTTAEGLPSNNVWSLLRDEAGRLTVITIDGVATFDDGRFSRVSLGGVSETPVTAMAEGGSKRWWLGTNQGVFAKDADGDKAIAIPALAHSGTVQALAVDRIGRVWIAGSDRLSVYQDGRLQLFGLRDGLPSKRITTIYEDGEQGVWIGTDNGVVLVRDGKLLRFGQTELSVNDPVLAMLRDREGNLWIGYETKGLSVLREERFRTYGSREGITDKLIRCVFEDGQGTLWAGTNGQGVMSLNGARFQSITIEDGLSSNVVLSLAEDAEGSLLVGTPDGLNIMKHGAIKVLTSSDGLPDDLIRSLYKDNDGSLWIGTRRGLSHYAGGRFTNYTQADGLPSDFIGSVARDRAGSLWIGTQHGLARLSDGRFRTYGSADGLHGEVITALYEDANAFLWIATADAGLNRFANGKMHHYPAGLGLPISVNGIIEDGSGHFWMTSKNGLSRVNKRALNQAASPNSEEAAVVAYGTADGLQVNEFSDGGHPTAWKDLGGTLWFATAKGVVAIDAKHAATNSIAPMMTMQRVEADNQPVKIENEVKLPPGAARISFEYAGLSFRAPQKVKYRYKLDGFDKSWIDADFRRVAYYTNLGPGHYRFSVLGRNNDGVLSKDAASVAIYLQPHFHQRIWFYLLLLAGALAVAYAAYRWRVKQVEMQFQAVLAERNRMAREIHDTLAQGFVAVSLQLEVASRLISSSSDPAKEMLQQAQQSVQAGLSEARRAIWNLRSQEAEEKGLATQLSNAVENAALNSRLKVQYSVAGAYRRLSPSVETELLRIGQEAVMNVVRHAKGENLRVVLAFDTTKVKLTITDDGMGFPVNADLRGPAGHYGLQGMRERAEEIGATLSVTSSPGNGCEVIVESKIK